MENKKILTFDDILQGKLKREQAKNETLFLYLKSYDAEIEVKRMEDSDFVNLMEKYKNDDEAFINRIIYECLVNPVLNTDEAMKSLKVDCTPDKQIQEVVTTAFPSFAERGQISTEILKFSNLDASGVSVVKKIKN